MLFAVMTDRRPTVFITRLSLTGIGEVVLLPLDVLKILRQTNPEAFRNRSFLSVVKDEGFSLYRGWGWTMARNAPGSFAVSRHGWARL